MKRRLRKKLHRAEFTEFGYYLGWTSASDEEYEATYFMVVDLAAPLGFKVGGGGGECGKRKKYNSYLVFEVGKESDSISSRLKTFLKQLEEIKPNSEFYLSDRFDIYNDSINDLPSPKHSLAEFLINF